MARALLLCVAVGAIVVIAYGSGPRWARANPTTGLAAVSAGSFHTCALTTGGGVKCWGNNEHGQLGNGTTTNRTTPTDANGLASGAVGVSSGGLDVFGRGYTCAVTARGGVKCWGENDGGQLGNGTTTDSSTPVDVTGLTSGVAAVSAGGAHTCALTTAGGVKCWGGNNYGQLGDGGACGLDCLAAVDVTGLTSGVATVSAGQYHACAITTSGGAKCWGYNLGGQLGNGTTTNSQSPVDVTGLTSGVAAVSAGAQHTCARTTAGGVKCWGANNDGQLGNGTTTTTGCYCVPTPVDVTGLTSGVAAVSAGGGYTCALNTEGGVECWGFNSDGQLGDGTITDSSTPVDVIGLTSGVSAVSTGSMHSCAFLASSTAKCWGFDLFGQLGNVPPTDNSSSFPVDVVNALKPTPTPRPTTTPVVPPLAGDVNCDGAVNAVDAALVLQYAARLLAAMPCQSAADVNRDGSVDAVDALLILQFSAGLLVHLPP